jgi:DNA-binding CsgD family transcriptional regulator
MAEKAGWTARCRPERIGSFLEAAYDLERDDQAWLAEVMRAARAVWGRGGPANGGIYDASDANAFSMASVHFIDCGEERLRVLREGLTLQTPSLVRRTLHRVSAGCNGSLRLPELEPMLDGMRRLGFGNALNVNGLDPSGRGVYFALWARDRANLPRAEMAIYRRLAHHLGAAYRCRRRLREGQAGRPTVDATEGAEAILDARHRVVHAIGPARDREARDDLTETAAARERARRGADMPGGLERWRPLTGARWTLVDSFERDGARYVVARENQPELRGLAALSTRERQVVAYLALGQSTKETAYALGISDVTVRVLVGRASTKLGVSSRDSLIAHHEVRQMNPAAEVRGAG